MLEEREREREREREKKMGEASQEEKLRGRRQLRRETIKKKKREGEARVEEEWKRRGGGGRRGECVRMLSASSSRPGDHTARPPCVPSPLFANISAIKHRSEWVNTWVTTIEPIFLLSGPRLKLEQLPGTSRRAVPPPPPPPPHTGEGQREISSHPRNAGEQTTLAGEHEHALRRRIDIAVYDASLKIHEGENFILAWLLSDDYRCAGCARRLSVISLSRARMIGRRVKQVWS